MHELSSDSEVTFRRELGSAENLPTKPGIGPFEDTRPIPDLSCIQHSPLTAASPSVIARSCTQLGSVLRPSSEVFGPQPKVFGPWPEVWSTVDQSTQDPTTLQ